MPTPVARRLRKACARSATALLLSLVFLSLLPIIMACSDGGSSAKKREMPPVPVAVSQAESRDLPVQTQAVGRVEALVSIQVKSRVMGQVMQVHFKEGDMVQQGQTLFTIDPRPYQVALKEAEAKLARDTALANKAESDFKRYQVLAGQKSVSESQFEQYRAEALSRRATVEEDQARVADARLQLGYCSIASPVGGVAGNLVLNEGNLVKANDDKPMVIILQVQPLYVSFSVPERYLGRIMELRKIHKLEVEAVVAGQEDHPQRGELVFVDNAVDPATGTVRLKGLFVNTELRLWPGQFARTTLRLDTVKDQIVVPTPAVLTGQKGPYLYVLAADSRVEARQVTTGAEVNGWTVIAKGLKPGEKVVTDGQSRLTAGSRVKVKDAAGKPKAEKRP